MEGQPTRRSKIGLAGPLKCSPYARLGRRLVVSIFDIIDLRDSVLISVPSGHRLFHKCINPFYTQEVAYNGEKILYRYIPAYIYRIHEQLVDTPEKKQQKIQLGHDFVCAYVYLTVVVLAAITAR